MTTDQTDHPTCLHCGRVLDDDEVAVKRVEGIGPERVHYLRAVAFDLDGDGDLDAAKVIRRYADALDAATNPYRQEADDARD